MTDYDFTTQKLSRRGFVVRAGLGLSALALLGCPVRLLEASEDQEVSLDVKIGQMLMIGFRGLEVNAEDPIVRDIQDLYLGGVMLFDYDVLLQSPVRNIQSPEQVKALISSLQSFASLPLLVAIDQEGGKIRRLKEKFGFPPTVSHQYLGTIDDSTVTHEHASAMAQTLSELGINVNLAPVVDLNVNPGNPVIGHLERSFSADPDVVIRNALEFIKAHHEQGVLCTLKHFPGHGSSTEDSHLGLVDITKTWSPIELKPYEEIVKAGQSDMIMTAHVFNANLDPDYPATLSKAVITGILREQLGYDGVVISDDMQMGAIDKQYGFETALRATIEAGVDIITIANNLAYDENVVARSVALIKQWVEDGLISEERIDRSYRRIQRLKGGLAANDLTSEALAADPAAN